jgi:hypothetical protein
MKKIILSAGLGVETTPKENTPIYYFLRKLYQFDGKLQIAWG